MLPDFSTRHHRNSLSPPKASQQLFYDIKKAVEETTECTELVFKDISPERGALLVDSLNEDGGFERRSSRLS
ncbi:hypothetical protein PISL3812_02395 [Talaromyces islandicus]|uniref:Uncharacterized protein n=1 Tax=Talaromyces islandicus TaxID=28573 RepID=A0A0U1LPT2_TALIS|nr:hypothetical protein PISL3812_02395 [Talaromyces islandicus]